MKLAVISERCDELEKDVLTQLKDVRFGFRRESNLCNHLLTTAIFKDDFNWERFMVFLTFVVVLAMRSRDTDKIVNWTHMFIEINV